jgi:hypothetical protein
MLPTKIIEGLVWKPFSLPLLFIIACISLPSKSKLDENNNNLFNSCSLIALDRKY